MGTINSWETLAYFKYTPVKAKIKIITNTHFCDLFYFLILFTSLHVLASTGIIAFKNDCVYFTGRG
jgi:hypothetical protein